MKEIEIAVPLGKSLRADEVKRTVARMFRLSRNAVIRVVDPTRPAGQDADLQASATCVISRRSIDARGKAVWRYRVEVYGADEAYEPYRLPGLSDVHGAPDVIVVGAGPAGMFAALKLLSLGLKPIVLERGKDVHARKADMASLSRDGVLDPDSNYCFGEGGAGAFSDGKLYTRSSKRGDNREVLYRLVEMGASPEILIDAHPHIGTDKLPAVVEHIRHRIEDLGGEYHFGAKVCGIEIQEDGVRVSTAGGRDFRAGAVILATGHSARDVYEMLDARGIELQAKGFALGVRVEHPQSLINDARYHGAFAPGMPAAEYSFVEQVDGRGVFSFCMCPGGILVPSSTEEETVVLNGMSNSARNSRWANSGVVVQVEPEDAPEEYSGDGAFALLNFQRDVERRMYTSVREAAPDAHPFAAPAQRMTDFCKGRVSMDLPETSYHPGAVSVPLHEVLPPMVANRLRKAFPLVDNKIRGYYTSDALLLGTESRTSSPVRIVRDPETLQCPAAPRVFPCGEGAGYSGGIVSSAIDGIRCALAAASLLQSTH
ncbi:MAG: NAD(P)/FAD-dependent oxidoreductase [Bacteroidales bacterium]|nr:NAD(P)/FAD-dependent oxidoreductase [Bacteroidales bacterium]